MKFRKTGRIAIAGLTVVAAVGLTACTDDKTDSPKPPRTTTSAVANPNLPPVPTVDQLNAQLQTALDTAVPSSAKLDLVQGIEADPELINRLAESYKQAGAKAEVTGVTPFGESISADGKITVNGQENPLTVPFVAENGKWKVQKTWACGLLQNFGQQSPACS